MLRDFYQGFVNALIHYAVPLNGAGVINEAPPLLLYSDFDLPEHARDFLIQEVVTLRQNNSELFRSSWLSGDNPIYARLLGACWAMMRNPRNKPYPPDWFRDCQEFPEFSELKKIKTTPVHLEQTLLGLSLKIGTPEAIT